MMEKLADWIKVVTATGLICSAVTALAPKGAPGRMLKLTCSVAMAIALLSLVSSFSFDAYSGFLAQQRQRAENAAEQGKNSAEVQKRVIIEEQCASYILDKGAELGVDLKVKVTARWSPEGYWLPQEVTIDGEVGEEEKRKLVNFIESQLGIGAGSQVWSTQNE